MAKKELKEDEEAVPGAEEKDSLAGSKAKKAKFRDCEEGREFECGLCDCKFFTVGQYSVHIQSFEHRKRTIQKMADSTFDQAPQYQGGREGHLPPGLSGRKVVHCKVCNVFTNSAKQLAEHLGGSRHKQLCFKFNVPVTTLALTKEDTHTLEATRLQGDKLMCKHCSVEINSMQQYQEHMNSAKHKLRAENKPLRPERSIKKALKAAYKTRRKRAKEEEEEGGSHEEEKDKGKEETEEEERKDHASSSSNSKVRDKYQLNLLDQLSELPTLRNEIHFYRQQRPAKEKKPAKVKPVPFMCDVCQVFTKSAFELNEHLMGEEHRAALKKFLVDGKASSAESQPLDADPAKAGVGEEELPKKPELYCDACQLLLPSLGAKREHEKGKKHKFLQELKKGMKTEPRSREGPATAAAAARGGGGDRKEGRPQETAASKSVHCNLCMVDVESEAAMKEHIKSKKHRFLSELKPEPEPVRRPEAAPKRKRPWPHDSSDRDRRGPAREDVMPELAAVALERQALQAELAKRRREIDEQRRLIDDLREEQHLEQEKAALRRMIDECRQLIEEREMRKRRAAEELDRAHKSRSVRWHPSVETERCQSGGSNSSSHEYWSFSMRWNEEIPLLGMPPVEGMSSVEDRWSGPSSDGPFWETDRSAPVSQEPFAGSTSTAHSPFGPSTNSWPGTQAGLLPDWPSASQEPDWQRPVLCSPPNTVGLLGDRPPEWGPSAPLLPSGTETHTWGGSSTTRIPGLDFV